MKKKQSTKGSQIQVRYEMLEAARLMEMRNKSVAGNTLPGMPANRSDALYRQAYKGNGVDYLLTGRKLLKPWRITIKTTGKDYDTGLLTIDPHQVVFEIKEPCTVASAIIAVSEYWSELLIPELARLHLDPVKIDVSMKSFNSK